MEKRGYLITCLWVLSLMALPLSNLPNRIVLGLLVIWFFLKYRSKALQIPYFKLFTATALVLVVLSGITNKVLSKELLLGLSLPAQGLFLIILRPNPAQFRKGFQTGLILLLLVLMKLKISTVLQMGVDSYFSQDQWWNLWHYKNFTQPLSLHPTYLSMFVLAGTVMLLFGSERPSLQNELKAGSLSIFGLYLVSLWLISSKIALIATVVVLFVFWIQKLVRSSKRQSIVIGILFAVAILVPLTSPATQYRLTHELKTAMLPLPTDVPNRFSERRALWKSAFVEMDRHPVSGTSFRGVKSREAIYPKAKFYYTPLEKPMNAHNNFIESGLRYGIVFGVLLFVSSIFGMYKAFRKRSVEILAFGLVCIIISMTESFIFREQGLSLTSLMLLFYYLIENEGNI
jgi:hypothetical protein